MAQFLLISSSWPSEVISNANLPLTLIDVRNSLTRRVIFVSWINVKLKKMRSGSRREVMVEQQLD